jgi:glyoxylase-like metal-dependent hydrolase (beta-lactamase superfamily II)
MHEVLMFTGGIAATNGFAFKAPDGWIVVDAPEGMADFLAEKNIRPAALLLTHAHFDHVMDAAAIAATGAAVYAWDASTPEDRLEPLVRQWTGTSLNIPDYPVHHPLQHHLDTPISVAGLHLSIAHVPGHSPDSLIFIDPTRARAFTGDTLMAGGVGRSDFPGGSHSLLIAGIRREILSLPPATVIFPGHGERSTVAEETDENPHLNP